MSHQSKSELEARTIVVLEDHAATAELLGRRLSGSGFITVYARSVSDCEDWAKRGCNAFILDANLGDGRSFEGLSALQRLKQIDPENFCVVFTADKDEQLRVAALKLSCDAFISTSSLELDFDQVLMALDRRWLARATRLSLTPGFRVSAQVMATKVDALRNVVSIDGRPFDRDERKSRLVARYQELLAQSGLAPQEEQELKQVDHALSEIERQEADEFEAGFATSRAGKLDQALDRIESYLQALRSATGS